MISGAAQADVALLMVPSNKGGFETSIAKGNHKKGEVQGQTRQHARLCHLLGIEQVICGINKMDDKSVNWSEDRYKEIKGEVDKMLTKIGYVSLSLYDYIQLFQFWESPLFLGVIRIFAKFQCGFCSETHALSLWL